MGLKEKRQREIERRRKKRERDRQKERKKELVCVCESVIGKEGNNERKGEKPVKKMERKLEV